MSKSEEILWYCRMSSDISKNSQDKNAHSVTLKQINLLYSISKSGILKTHKQC